MYKGVNPKIGGLKTPKMDGLYKIREKTYEQMGWFFGGYTTMFVSEELRWFTLHLFFAGGFVGIFAHLSALIVVSTNGMLSRSSFDVPGIFQLELFKPLELVQTTEI